MGTLTTCVCLFEMISCCIEEAGSLLEVCGASGIVWKESGSGSFSVFAPQSDSGSLEVLTAKG
jgi:hypothetical protein